MYNGMTGEQIESAIFIGPTYYMRLKHMVKDKINYRARGPRTLMTRQTNHGRANDGGLRIGEMERDGVIAHGMSTFLYDSLMNRGDAYKVAICNHTGTIAIYNKETDHFYSPLVDGPIQYDVLDKTIYTPNLVTKYGKEFSIVEIPYSFKLLMQELTSMNVQMRLITADNIEQFIKEDRRIFDGQVQTNSASSSPKEEDIFERLKRENENQLRLERNQENQEKENKTNTGEVELLTPNEKTQILNMTQQQIKAFINGHSVSDLTPLQQKNFATIIGTSPRYLRLEQEMTNNELYKLLLSEEIDKIFEPTDSERAMYKELYGENLNNQIQEKFTIGTTFGGGEKNMIVQKEGHEQSGGSIETFISDSIEPQGQSERYTNSEGETKVIKI
jgi:hypothetical protein